MGHSIGSAAGDQISNTLGIWAHGILPGITTMDSVAEDVCQEHLSFSSDHRELDTDAHQYAIINSKGFGGNNATATLLSPGTTRRMLQARYSDRDIANWERANEEYASDNRPMMTG